MLTQSPVNVDDAAKPLDDVSDPSVKNRLCDEIAAMGIDIETSAKNIGELREAQKHAMSSLVCGNDDEAIAKDIKRSLEIVQQMFKLIDTALQVPAGLDVAERRLVAKAIGFWALGKYLVAAELLRTLKKPNGSDAGGELPPAVELLSDEAMSALVEKIASLKGRNMDVARCLALGADVIAEFNLEPSTRDQYVSKVLTLLGLSRRALGRDRCFAILKVAYIRSQNSLPPQGEAKPEVSTPAAAAPKQEKEARGVRATFVSPAVHVSIPVGHTKVTDVDQSDDDHEAQTAALIAEGYEVTGYVIFENSDRRLLVLSKP